MELLYKIVVLLLVTFSVKVALATSIELSSNQYQSEVIIEDDTLIESHIVVNEEVKQLKHRRFKAILFTVLTGPLGGHRIYFGSKPRTAIIYAVTLGGLGILPLIDLVHIIFTKDVSKFDNKPQIIMWTE